MLINQLITGGPHETCRCDAQTLILQAVVPRASQGVTLAQEVAAQEAKHMQSVVQGHHNGWQLLGT